MERTRKLPDWILNSDSIKKDVVVILDEESAMLENTREAIKILEEHEWKKDWGEWSAEEEDVEFDLSQSSVMDVMTHQEVMQIITKVKGEVYTSSYPFYDDRDGLVNDLRSSLVIYCASSGIAYFE
jgi:hypothetical protein